MNIETLANDLVANSDAKFYGSLAAVQELQEAAATDFLVSYLAKLQASTSLAEFKKSQRLTAVLRSLRTDAEGWNRVISGAGALAPSLRNTLAQYLPPRNKRALSFSAVSVQSSVATGPILGELEEDFDVEHIAPKDSECSIVAILSKPQLQNATRALLRDRGFAAIVWDTVSKLRDDLESSGGDVCGFLLDSSVLSELSEMEQRALISELAAYSTFTWIRIDTRGLLVGYAEVEELIGEARAATARVSANLLSMQPTGVLVSAEVEYLERARASLRTHRSVAFIPGELNGAQTRLLIAAAKDYADEEQFARDVKIVSLETKILQGGESEACIAQIRVNRSGRSIIAKLASREQISEEITRFRRYIQPWDNELRPRVYFHGDAALILFALVRAGVDSDDRAPVLAECLRESWDKEVFGGEDVSEEQARREIYLTDAVRSAATLICTLNMISAPHGVAPVADPSIYEPLYQRLEQRKIDWDFDDAFRVARRSAAARFARLAGAAVTHGDLHLKNILVRGNEDVHLIDYASSGPGHPAVDLVRLELALLLGVARQLTSEAVAIEMQRAVSLDQISAAEMAARFPSFHACRLNRIAMAGCIAARDAAMSVLTRYGGIKDDYLAAKVTIAWQNLIMHDRQTMMARSIIIALQPNMARETSGLITAA